jgi:hypothetical protein
MSVVVQVIDVTHRDTGKQFIEIIMIIIQIIHSNIGSPVRTGSGTELNR